MEQRRRSATAKLISSKFGLTRFPKNCHFPVLSHTRHLPAMETVKNGLRQKQYWMFRTKASGMFSRMIGSYRWAKLWLRKWTSYPWPSLQTRPPWSFQHAQVNRCKIGLINLKILWMCSQEYRHGHCALLSRIRHEKQMCTIIFLNKEEEKSGHFYSAVSQSPTRVSIPHFARSTILYTLKLHR